MMVHLMNSARVMQLRNVELCRDAANPAIRVGGTKNDRGEVTREGELPADPDSRAPDTSVHTGEATE